MSEPHINPALGLTADLNGDGLADILGFHDDGVHVALNNGDGTFTESPTVLKAFGYGEGAGGWRVDRHPRLLADLTGNGLADIIGFGVHGVYVALNHGDGTFAESPQILKGFGYGPEAGGWRVDRDPRFMADLTGRGRADIIGFGDDGVRIALSNGDGTFADPVTVLPKFGYATHDGTWRVDRHPRFPADLTGDGLADIIGFHDDGVYVSLNLGNGKFTEPAKVLDAFAYGPGVGGWRVDRDPRFMADLTGRRHIELTGKLRASIVGFKDDGVWVALNRGGGTFAEPTRVLETFRSDNGAGGWRVDRHPRFAVGIGAIG